MCDMPDLSNLSDDQRAILKRIKRAADGGVTDHGVNCTVFFDCDVSMEIAKAAHIAQVPFEVAAQVLFPEAYVQGDVDAAEVLAS